MGLDNLLMKLQAREKSNSVTTVTDKLHNKVTHNLLNIKNVTAVTAKSNPSNYDPIRGLYMWKVKFQDGDNLEFGECPPLSTRAEIIERLAFKCAVDAEPIPYRHETGAANEQPIIEPIPINKVVEKISKLPPYNFKPDRCDRCLHHSRAGTALTCHLRTDLKHLHGRLYERPADNGKSCKEWKPDQREQVCPSNWGNEI